MVKRIAIECDTDDQLDFVPQVVNLVSKLGFAPELLSSEQILAGELFDFDAVIFPGGLGGFYGLRQYEAFNDAVRYFVANGGGYMGVCVPPDTLVYTNSQVKLISKVNVGDRVLSHEGYKEVTRVFERPYSGKLFQIKTWGGETIKLTPEHPIYVIRAKRPFGKQDRFKKTVTTNPNPKWIKADDIHLGDYILQRFSDNVMDVEQIDITKYLTIPFTEKDNRICAAHKWAGHKRGFTTLRPRPNSQIAKSLPVSDDFLKLAGLYLAEGFLTEHRVQFSFGDHETELIMRTKQLCERLFRKHADIRKARTATIVRLNSKIASNLFLNLFGKGAKNKRLPSWMLSLPSNKQQVLLDAYCEGDGSKDKKHGERFWTISIQLAYQVSQILYRLGRPNNILRKEAGSYNIEGRVGLSNVSYTVGAMLDPNRSYSYICDGFAFLPVREISTMPYEGRVLNLEVENANSYTIAGATVHNCAGAYVAGLRMTEFLYSYCPRTLGLIDAKIVSPPFIRYIGEYREAAGERVLVTCKVTDEPHSIVTPYEDQEIDIVYSAGPLIREIGPDVTPLLTYVDGIMLPGDVALCCSVFGKGRVVISSPHPETPWGEELVNTGCQEWLYLNMLSWVSQPEEKAYFPFPPWELGKRLLPYPAGPAALLFLFGAVTTLGLAQLAKRRP